METSITKEEFLHSHRFLEMRCRVIQGSPRVSQETEVVGKIQPRAFITVSTRKVRRGRVSRFNIGYFDFE